MRGGETFRWADLQTYTCPRIFMSMCVSHGNDGGAACALLFGRRPWLQDCWVRLPSCHNYHEPSVSFFSPFSLVLSSSSSWGLGEGTEREKLRQHLVRSRLYKNRSVFSIPDSGMDRVAPLRFNYTAASRLFLRTCPVHLAHEHTGSTNWAKKHTVIRDREISKVSHEQFHGKYPSSVRGESVL